MMTIELFGTPACRREIMMNERTDLTVSGVL